MHGVKNFVDSTNTFLIIFFLLFFISSNSEAQKNTRPNIIYIMADDLGYADLGCYGRKNYHTPNLDKLASQGVKFMNAYAAAPVCTPTRVAFFTGRYPARLAVGLKEPIDWTTKDSLIGLSPATPSLPMLLKQGGYETWLIGKWHLGFKREFSPMKNGFDHFFGFHGGGIDYISHTDPDGNNDLFESDLPIRREGYLTDILAAKAVEIIKTSHHNPFFLCVMFNAPHWPWQATGDKPYPLGNAEWKSGGSPVVYGAMMKSLDDAVGLIVKSLDEEKLDGNTIVIFTSDNGGEKFSDMGPFSGKKMELREGGIREPAFVRWTGKITAGKVTNQVVTTMDWTATILAVSGVKEDLDFPLDGINIMPVCIGKRQEVERTLYWRIFQRAKQKAMRKGDWKYLQDEKGEYLFDLSNDLGEKNDLKEKEKKVFEKLKRQYKLWESTVLEPVPLGN